MTSGVAAKNFNFCNIFYFVTFAKIFFKELIK